MTTTGAELIAAERERQLTELGYTLEHDSAHDDSDLAFAAACYAAPATIYLMMRVDDDGTEGRKGGTMRWVEPWPGWDRTPRVVLADREAKREARVRELVKAGALIAAEIDRLQAQEDE